MSLVPKEAKIVPKAPQKAPKTIPKGTPSAVENRLDEKSPQDLPKGPFVHVLECASVLFLLHFKFVLPFVLLISPVVVAI